MKNWKKNEQKAKNKFINAEAVKLLKAFIKEI
jgi:hypothetical protein